MNIQQRQAQIQRILRQKIRPQDLKICTQQQISKRRYKVFDESKFQAQRRRISMQQKPRQKFGSQNRLSFLDYTIRSNTQQYYEAKQVKIPLIKPNILSQSQQKRNQFNNEVIDVSEDDDDNGIPNINHNTNVKNNNFNKDKLSQSEIMIDQSDSSNKQQKQPPNLENYNIFSDDNPWNQGKKSQSNAIVFSFDNSKVQNPTTNFTDVFKNNNGFSLNFNNNGAITNKNQNQEKNNKQDAPSIFSQDNPFFHMKPISFNNSQKRQQQKKEPIAEKEKQSTIENKKKNNSQQIRLFGNNLDNLFKFNYSTIVIPDTQENKQQKKVQNQQTVPFFNNSGPNIFLNNSQNKPQEQKSSNVFNKQFHEQQKPTPFFNFNNESSGSLNVSNQSLFISPPSNPFSVSEMFGNNKKSQENKNEDKKQKESSKLSEQNPLFNIKNEQTPSIFGNPGGFFKQENKKNDQEKEKPQPAVNKQEPKGNLFESKKDDKVQTSGNIFSINNNNSNIFINKPNQTSIFSKLNQQKQVKKDQVDPSANPSSSPSKNMFGLSSQQNNNGGLFSFLPSSNQNAFSNNLSGTTSFFTPSSNNPNPNSLFGGGGNIFNLQTPSSTGGIFGVHQKNEDQQGQGQGQDDNEPIAQQDNADPSKSTGNYKYEETQTLFKQVAPKFKRQKKDAQLIELVTVSIQKIPGQSAKRLIIRLANKSIPDYGDVIIHPTSTQITRGANNKKSLTIRKLMRKDGQGKWVFQAFKIMFKEDSHGDEFLKVCQQEKTK